MVVNMNLVDKILEWQRDILEKEYADNCRPKMVRRHIIAAATGLSVKTVQVWFQNQRQRRKNSLPPFGELFPLVTLGDTAEPQGYTSSLPVIVQVPQSEIALEDVIWMQNQSLLLSTFPPRANITFPDYEVSDLFGIL